MNSTEKRLNRLEAALKRQPEPVYTIVLKSGRTLTGCNECLLESFVWNPERHGLIKEVIASNPADQGVADMLYNGLSQEEGLDVKEYQRRLRKLEQELTAKRDPVFSVVLKDGTIDRCDYEHAWAFSETEEMMCNPYLLTARITPKTPRCFRRFADHDDCRA